ncbi:MAG TPA: pyruvate formate lyase family protein [Rectinemataceae bacterium]|nr:pyruvate formate lyase family protein [Rectinemataceae bacterium]
MATLKEPYGLSARVERLRSWYFEGADRRWNNEYTAWTTGTPWDRQFNEMTYYIVPEVYTLIGAMGHSFRLAARPVPLRPDFWKLSLPERRAWFVKEVMVRHVPRDLLPGDLLAGSRFNVQTSLCLDKKEAKDYDLVVAGKKGARKAVIDFHAHGYGNAGATSGHLIPGHAELLAKGWKGRRAEVEAALAALSEKARQGPRGAELRAMQIACEMPRELAAAYAADCAALASRCEEPRRRAELETMAATLKRVPWEPARGFREAVQALWLNHMLVMVDENYPGPGVSFGRIDQYLLPYWEASKAEGMTKEEAKEILGCFWFHCNTAYDAQIRTGNNGITAGFGQLFNLSGLGRDGKDASNELTYMFLELIDEMSPILEPKPNVRLHRESPESLLDKVVSMIEASQGAPFLLNFDERSMAGLRREAREAEVPNFIGADKVYDYASVGCLENTMVGNDRSGTVDCNLNLLKAVELALTGGEDLLPTTDSMSGKTSEPRREGPATGDARNFGNWEEFWAAYVAQTRFIVSRIVELYERSESIRARFFPTPYLSTMIKGCVEEGLDITEGGAELGFVTLEAVTFATTVDSLLAVKHLVFDKKECSMETLIAALRANWVSPTGKEGYEVLRAKARNKAPKYGRDEEEADALAKAVMDLWCAETWKHHTKSTLRQFRPGMLSWNYWAGDGYIMAASPDGREKGQFLSNAICPSNGADIKGPTSNANSVGTVLGGRSAEGADWEDYLCALPNGASHTMTFNPSILRDAEHRAKFKAFLRGYAENGGTALQINMLDPAMLRDAQAKPQEYRHLLVRVTGYNAYFTTIGRELQDEVIARVSHGHF